MSITMQRNTTLRNATQRNATQHNAIKLTHNSQSTVDVREKYFKQVFVVVICCCFYLVFVVFVVVVVVVVFKGIGHREYKIV